MMTWILLKVFGVLACWWIWYMLFGIDCYLNGLITRRSWDLPFYGLYQDITWLLHPSRRPESYPVLNWMHGLLVLPVVLACIY